MLCAAAFVGCTFRSEVPETALVRCGPAGECPKGYRCNTDFDECRRDSSGGDAPVLTASLMPSRIARRGAHLTLVVEADRALRSEPRVRLQYPGGSLVLSPESTSTDFTRTSYGVDLTASFNEGLVVFFGDAISTTGALATGVRLTDLVLDDTAPRLLGATVTPDHAQKGTRVSVRAELDEPVQDTLRLRVSRAGQPDQTFAATTNRAGTASFQVSLPATAVDGVASLVLVDVVDEAGNPAMGPLPLPSLTIDSTPPVAAPFALDAGRFSKHPGHDELRFSVAFDEPVSDVRWCLANRCASLPDTATSVFVSIADAGFDEGPAPLVVTGRDVAGNVGTRTEFITLDYSAPALTSEPTAITTARPDCPFRTVSAVGIGGAHTVSFNVDEALGLEPVVNLAPSQQPVWQPVNTFDGGTSYTFVHRATTTGNDVSGAVMARVVDTVGNEGLLTLVPSLRIDLTPPLPLNDAGLSQLRYERVPWGAERTGGVPRFSVECASCALGSDDVMVFFEEADATSFVLGEGRPSSNGALPRVEFSRTDRQRVWFTRHDEACNAATAVPQAVKQSTWVASALRPAGSPANPHTLTTAESASLAPASSRRTPALSTPTITLTAHGAWQSRLANPPRVSLSARTGDAMLVADPQRGRTILLGGNPAAVQQVGVFDGTTWDSVAVPATMSPPFATGGVFEAHTGRVVFLAGNTTAGLETWVLDGDSISEVATPRGLAVSDYPALAYDAAGRRVVALGGSGSTRTWTLAEDGWHELFATNNSPLPANERHFVYDAARQRLLLLSKPGLTWETWELSGSRWRFISSPPHRGLGVGVVWDERLGTVVMHGGGDCCSSTNLTARLEADGGWATLPVPAQVPPRSNHDLAYDPEHRRLVTCGGFSGTTPPFSLDCWALDDSGWRRLEGPTADVLMTGTSMVFDPATRKLLLMGGGTNDTWLLDGDVWVRHAAPADFLPRPNPTLAWEPGHGRVLLVGGISSPDGGATVYLNDVWSLSTTTTRLADAPFTPRNQHTMVADPARARVALIGGRNSSGTYLPMETWFFNGQWSSLPAPSGMTGRGLSAGAADPVTGRMALFGGTFPPASAREVWLFDGTTWAAHPSLPSGWNPQRRVTLAYDRAHANFLSFTGSTTGTLPDGGAVARTETWGFDDTTFTAAAPPTSSRFSAGASIDPATGRLVTFGGTLETGVVVAETWTMQGAQWTQQPTPGGLAARTGASMCFHAMSGQHVLIGGGPSVSTFTDDAWVFGDDGWSPVSLPSTFTSRAGLVCAVDETRNVVLALGGAQSSDISEFGLDPRSGPALLFSVDLTNVLPAGASALGFTATVRAAGDSVTVSDPLGGRAFLLPDGGAELFDGGLMPSDGGSFRPSSRPLPGAALQAWDWGRGDFVTLATTSQRPDAGLTMLAATYVPEAGVVLNADLLRLQVTTLGGSDVTRAPGLRATVVTERPELELRYVVP